MAKRAGRPGTWMDAHGPKHVLIYRHLKDQMERGGIPNGDYLPPENRLAEDFGVSVGTVKKALQRLKAENYVQRRKGDGTRVSFSPTSSRDAKAVAILLGTIRRSFYAEIYGGVQQELDRHQYKPILIDTRSSLEREREALGRYGKLAGGFIVAPVRDNRNHALYGQLLADGVPLVFVDRYLPELNVDAVVSDNVQGGYLATRHLLEKGHRRIAAPAPTGETSMQHRIDGYRRALEESGVPFDERLLIGAKETGFDAGYEFASRIAADLPDVTAAACMRDDTAWGCMQRLAELGIEVPGQFSVVGYDDNEDICCRLRPRLTTIRQPKAEVGVEAARRLIAKLEGRSKDAPSVVSLPVELVRRESDGPPRRGAIRGRAKAAGGGRR